LNPYTFRYQILSLACLPISPPRRLVGQGEPCHVQKIVRGMPSFTANATVIRPDLELFPGDGVEGFSGIHNALNTSDKHRAIPRRKLPAWLPKSEGMCCNLEAMARKLEGMSSKDEDISRNVEDLCRNLEDVSRSLEGSPAAMKSSPASWKGPPASLKRPAATVKMSAAVLKTSPAGPKTIAARLKTPATRSRALQGQPIDRGTPIIQFSPDSRVGSVRPRP
jgi:hypothetical protein